MATKQGFCSNMRCLVSKVLQHRWGGGGSGGKRKTAMGTVSCVRLPRQTPARINRTPCTHTPEQILAAGPRSCFICCFVPVDTAVMCCSALHRAPAVIIKIDAIGISVQRHPRSMQTIHLSRWHSFVAVNLVRGITTTGRLDYTFYFFPIK